MSYALIGAVLFAVFAAVAFAFLFRGLLAPGRDRQADLEWSSEFSIAKYRPMERLFLEEDYDFLAAQPGFHPRIYRKLQAERRRVFRHYLRCLRRDFNRLSAAAKLLLLSAPSDRPDLASALLKQRMIFTYAMAAVEFRLVLQSMGIGTVDVRRLVDAVDGMREQLGYFAHRAAVPTV
ncbi:MAG: hypothetical protein ACM336_04935 [Acidobacteriota bacterium]